MNIAQKRYEGWNKRFNTKIDNIKSRIDDVHETIDAKEKEITDYLQMRDEELKKAKRTYLNLCKQHKNKSTKKKAKKTVKTRPGA
jgi:F0F1-type ATP synthase membrane subunit b/b'